MQFNTLVELNAALQKHVHSLEQHHNCFEDENPTVIIPAFTVYILRTHTYQRLAIPRF